MSYTVVVIAYRSRAVLEPFLQHLGAGVPVIVVDNSSDEDDLSDLATASDVTVVDAGGNVGFSAGANIGAAAASTDHVVFMNPDTLPTGDALDRLTRVLDQDAGVTMCGPSGVDTAGGGAQPTIPRVAVHVLGLHRVLPRAGIYLHPAPDERIEAGWISGSCCAVRRADFQRIGGFDEGYFVFMSDFELGLRVTASGGRQLLLGDVVVPHLDGASSDLPSSWTWDQRGQGWGQFLRRTQPSWRARIVYSMLLAGFSARRLAYAATGRSLRAEEQATMVAGMRRTWRSEAPPSAAP